MQLLLSKDNVVQMPFDAMTDILQGVYEIDIVYSKTSVQLIQFSNALSYVTTLWAIMENEVKRMKQLKCPKSDIDEAIAKRDYLERVLSVLKNKCMVISTMLKNKE